MTADLVCASGVPRLMDYLEDALPADVRRELEGHVAGCPRCAAFVASYRETPRIVREASAMAVPAEREASLLQFLRLRRRP